MTNLTQDQLAQLIASVVSQVMQGQSAAPKAASGKPPITDLAAKDRYLVNSFHRRGFKDVQLMNRLDKSQPFNIRPYRGWIELGRRVRKGERGVRGLFHVDQTDPIAPKPELTSERKQMFRKAKAKLQPVRS